LVLLLVGQVKEDKIFLLRERGREKCEIGNFIGKTEGKRLLGGPKCRWKAIKLNIEEIECEGGDWTQLTVDISSFGFLRSW
jgi:hypothetical protein